MLYFSLAVENDLGEFKTSQLFIANLYHKIDF